MKKAFGDGRLGAEAQRPVAVAGWPATMCGGLAPGGGGLGPMSGGGLGPASVLPTRLGRGGAGATGGYRG
jgi:hypothetical protein